MDPYAMLEEIFESEAALVGFLGTFLVIMLVLLVVLWAYAITAYVLHSLGLYKIAKRRGIHNPWLAWLPVGQAWILGSISDHYQYAAKGKQRNYRKILMGLEIGVLCLSVVTTFVSGAASFGTSMSGLSGTEAAMLGMMGTNMLMSLLSAAASIAYAVFSAIAIYDLYRSSKPKNAVLFLVLSIVLDVTAPFFVFACRNADEGMPPKVRNTIDA